MLDEIKTIYGDVSEGLKFLETKHAGLFAVWTALLIAIITNDGFEAWPILTKNIVIIPILIGATINLISFMPFLNKCRYIKKQCYKKYKDCKENSVFYQSVFVMTYREDERFDLSVETYKNCLMSRMGDTQDISSKMSEDYIEQIVSVATVGTIKAYLFSLATRYALAVIGVVCIGLIIA